VAIQIKIFLITSLVINSFSLPAQIITGSVVCNKMPVSHATIAIINTPTGAIADIEGRFQITLPESQDTLFYLQIRALGYESKTITIRPHNKASLNLGIIAIHEDVLGLNEVVITANMEENYLRDSPVKTQVISGSLIQKFIPAQNLMESLTLITGVQEVNACGVCYTNNISINGLPGYYTALLIDGAPIYGSLAAIYGLNSIPSLIIDRVEVIRGPNSTLYGSEAMAGVINIITKNPAQQAIVNADFVFGSLGTATGNLAFSSKMKKWSNYTGITASNATGYFDYNRDGFGDRPNFERLSVFSKAKMTRPDNRELSVTGRFYTEDRRNGVSDFMNNRDYKQLRGNDSVYGESIATKRAELFGAYEIKSSEKLRFDYSLSYHHQHSWYGSVFYKAQQQTAFTNFTWRKKISRHFILGGVTLRQQFYEDNADVLISQHIEKLEFTPGIFIQNEWNLSKKLTILGGTRFDYHQTHGLIWSPRISIKQEIGKWTTLRINSGTGFRAVNLLTEDHAFISSQRAIIVAEKLKPEQSFNTTISINHLYTIREHSGTIELDIFYNHFNNKIIPDYSESDKIIYQNSRGNAHSTGAGVYLNHRFTVPLNVQGGFNVQRVQRSEKDDLQNITHTPVEFAPLYTWMILGNYAHGKSGISLSYTLRATGPMELPQVFDLTDGGEVLAQSRPTRSNAFALHHLQITKKFSSIQLEVYGGVQNIFNFKQPESPLAAYNDPNTSPGFSPHFDTSYAYAPLTGREFFFGIRWKTNK
jgi:outer membrane receptor for ferrienterochelin and colicins